MFNRTLEKKKENKNARKKCNIAVNYYENIQTEKPTEELKKSYLICPVLIHITPDIFSGKDSWEQSWYALSFLILFSCDVLHAASIASWKDICSCGRCSKTFHLQAQKNSQWGWGKGSKGQGRRDAILEWLSNHALTTLGMVECHVVACDHIYWQVVSHLSLSLASVFGADLLNSHIYARVHFSTQDQHKEFLFTVYHMIMRLKEP